MKQLFPTVAAVLLAAGSARAGAPSVAAHLEPDSVMIGDRFDLVVEVDKDMVQTVVFPTFEGGASGSVEQVSEHPVDTAAREGRRLLLRKRYTLQAFEEGRISVGRVGVLYADKNVTDTLYSADSLVLDVGTFLIDSTSQPVTALKPQKTLPFRFAEIGGYAAWGFGGLLLLAAIIYAALRILRHYGRSVGDLFRPAPPVPPHVAAINALEELHHRKLWQNGRYKQYYSGISDILRTYIAARYGIGAMEMTSDEILAAMRGVELPQKSAMDLTAILRDADLVKFAKAEPDAEQNENDYTRAYYFVEETKEREVEPGEADETSVRIDS